MNQNRNDETKYINTSSAAKDAAIINKPDKGAAANAMRSVQGIAPATTMESPIVIAIDHGYGNIKTPTFIFPACVTPCDGDMFLSTDDILTYEGKRYAISTGHKEFRQDKIMDKAALPLAKLVRLKAELPRLNPAD